MTKTYFAPSTMGFYVDNIHGPRTIPVTQKDKSVVEESNPNTKIPEDAVEITTELHREMINGQNGGKVIVAGEGGQPTLQDPPPVNPDTVWPGVLVQIDQAVQRAALMTAKTSPLSADAKKAWQKWADDMAALPQKFKDPTKIVWPQSPA